MSKRKSPINLVEDGLCNVEEGAIFLGIGRATMWELIRRGDIKVVRIGRSVRVPKRALVEFAAGRLTA